MKFNSQICTTREQSERLLSLGLKKETADMVYHSYGYIIDEFGNKERRFKQPTIRNLQDYEGKYAIPAWSLHRLIEMALQDILLCGISFVYAEDAYEKIIRIIESSIKDGRFRKEYLEE